MRNKLSMLLLLLVWFGSQNLYAQSPRDRVRTPEQEKQWQDAVAVNHMLLMRQNPSATRTPKEPQVTKEAEKTQEPRLATLNTTAERELAVRKLTRKHNAGSLSPATGAVAVMEAQGVNTLAEVKLDKLSEAQQNELFNTEPTLNEMWQRYEQKLAQMDKKTQDQLRKQLWEQHLNKEVRVK